MIDVGRGHALDILASVVSCLHEQTPLNKKLFPPEHRVSCHRCGNIRKRKLECPRKTCPHIFCARFVLTNFIYMYHNFFLVKGVPTKCVKSTVTTFLSMAALW